MLRAAVSYRKITYALSGQANNSHAVENKKGYTLSNI
jgi:hypothetical protein